MLVLPSHQFGLDIEVQEIAATRLEADVTRLGLVATAVRKEAGGATASVLCRSTDEMIDAERSLMELYGAGLVRSVDGVLDVHRGGKLSIRSRKPIRDRQQLAQTYTPGVGRVASLIADAPELAWQFTGRNNTIAVVSDGSAVLGLGDLGPLAALPVMEGKASLFAELAGINAVPLCLDTTNPDAIIEIVSAIAPSFGGINLEDISAPRCFEIERLLEARLDIPVFHDDQHGTAIVVLAALTNAAAVTGRCLADMRVVVAGTGAAGSAIARFLLAAGIGDITMWSRHGILAEDMDLPPDQAELASFTNSRGLRGGLAEALPSADVFIGVSGAGVVQRAHVLAMAPDPIVFALANPVPEIEPDLISDVAGVVATGRSNDINQVNNLLAFPGIFRGALDAGARRISGPMKVAAAATLAALVRSPTRTHVLPDPLDLATHAAVARAVADVAVNESPANSR